MKGRTEIRTSVTSAAAYCVLQGFPILRVELHSVKKDALAYILPAAASAALDQWFDTINPLHERARRELARMHSHTTNEHEGPDHGSEHQPEQHQR
jgi:hypothetical protein